MLGTSRWPLRQILVVVEREREREREMEETRGAAMAYYARMSDDQRQSFEKFKSLMDGNGDGKVSSQEYLNFIRKQGYDHVPSNLFGLLDGNNRGYLNFEECVTLFYMITCNRFVFCGGYDCKSPLLLGLHFVCVECYRVGTGNFNLCSSCYGTTNFDHDHEHSFLDNYDLLHSKAWEGNKLSSTSGVVGSLDKRDKMKDLVKTARLYYSKSSIDVQEAAQNFFKSLDYNNDGKVSLYEFLSFMRKEGHKKMSSHHFFKELDKDGSGTLEFMEAMALYYVIKSGRPFCSGCDEFIPGMYFACSKCFGNDHKLFCVCPMCFEEELYVHEHVQFLDNYALLEARRMQGFATYSNQHKPSSSVTITEEPTSTTNVVVLYERSKPQWGNIAYNALNVAMSVAANWASCTIM